MDQLNLVLRFLLELVALAALAYAGFLLPPDGLLRWIAAGVLPLAFAAVWGTFVAPRAPNRLRDPAKLLLEVVLFGGAAAAIYLAGFPGLAVLYGVIVAGNLALMFYFRQREH